MRVLSITASLLLCLAVSAADVTDDVLEITKQPGGLAVVIGGDDAKMPAELVARGYVVQSLDDDEQKIAEAKRFFSSAGVHGRATAIEFDGKHLPYVDNLVNLLVLRDAESEISAAELNRALAPRGVSISAFASNPSGLKAQQVGDWFVYRKPVPDTIDDWPMHMYEPGNNAVSRDSAVGPPKHLRWRSGPTWTRSHEFASSLNAMVSMNGKLFYVMDEGSRLSPILPEKWTLVCRDAFNGIVLWKRPLPSWHTHWWPVKSGPTQAMRRRVGPRANP